MTDTIAIDFGTSRTKLAYLKDGKPELMRFGHDRVYAPSLFYLPAGDGAIRWGNDAEEMLTRDPAGVVVTLKRQLGERNIRGAGGRKETPGRLLALMLSDLRRWAGERLPAFGGQPPSRVCLTLPSLYRPVEERALRDAAAEAGFAADAVELLPEPVAAARAWLAETGNAADEVVVFDAGGGTIDWAYLRRENGAFRVVPECPADGDRQVGGHDVDELLLELLEEAAGADLASRRSHFLQEVRTLKEAFCRDLPLHPIRVGGREITLPAKAIADAIEERFISQACDALGSYLDKVRTVADSKGLPPVLLVGGSSALKGLALALEQRLECKTAQWERSEFATVLGGVPPYGPTDKDRRWIYYSPEFLAFLRERRTWINNGDWFGCEVPNMDAMKLLELGMARIAGLPDFGHFYLYISKPAMLANGFNEMLVAFLRNSPDTDVPYLEGDCLVEKTSSAVELFDDFPNSNKLLEAVYLKRVCHDDTDGRRHLGAFTRHLLIETSKPCRFTGAYPIELLCDAASCWAHVYNDDDRARRCLQACELEIGSDEDENEVAMNLSDYPIEKVAGAFLSLWRDDYSAMRILKKTREMASNVECEHYIWSDMAMAYWKLLGDRETAYTLLRKAETSRGTNLWFWSRAAVNWLLLDDVQRCARALAKAEDFSGRVTPSPLRVCASVWKILGDDLAVKRCLERAEASIQVRGHSRLPDKLSCAQSWATLLYDKQKSIGLLEGVELESQSSDHLIRCARIWHSCLQDSVRAENCIRRAETLPDVNWKACAILWRMLGRVAEASRCEAKRLEFRA